MTVAKRRIRLDVNGVVCALITHESDEYMYSLSEEVSTIMSEMLTSSPFITREMAALTLALGYCDDIKKQADKISQLEEQMNELEKRSEELERENGQLWEETDELIAKQAAGGEVIDASAQKQRIQKRVARAVETEKRKLAVEKKPKKQNPFRIGEEFEQQGFISFFEQE